MNEPLAVEIRGLSKRFGQCVANADIHLRVKSGTIHAIIGENGAGKSTAMKMLYGMYAPDTGEIRVHGEPRAWRSPSDAIAAGIGMVHQHFMLAGPYDPVENILVGAEPALARWKWLPRALRPVDRAGGLAKLQRLSEQYGLSVDWEASVEELPVGVQQRIEILKLLYRDASILILDEPTAVLTPQETAELFANLRKLCDEGKTVLIITHKLKEVMAVADEVTVFRAGRVVGQVSVAQTNVDELAAMMVGRKVNLQIEAPPAPKLGETLLELRGELDLEVRAGEIVGIAGVEGNGQSELLQLLLHPRDYCRRARGELRLLGREAMARGRALSTAEIKALGVGLIPEDRHLQGLLLERPVRENFLLGLHRRAPFARRRFGLGWLRGAEIERATQAALEAYDVRPRSTEVAIGGLSGGNQQKLIIAREFAMRPRLMIAAQPTRGVDVGAIEFIHGQILKARAEGTGVLLVSSELDEILALSDRVLVMYGGKIVARFDRGERADGSRFDDPAFIKMLGIAMGGGRV